MPFIFSYYKNLISFYINKINTSKTSFISDMFQKLNILGSLNFKNFISSWVGSMAPMAINIIYLTSIDLSNFIISLIDEMDYILYNCKTLISFNLRIFETIKVEL